MGRFTPLLILSPILSVVLIGGEPPSPNPPEPAPRPGVTSPASAASERRASEIAEIKALADELVKLGLPDARGGRFWKGKIVFIKPDGTFHSQFLGIHLELANGSWLLDLRESFVPAPGVTVMTAQAEKLTAPQLLDEVLRLVPGVQERRADADRQRATATPEQLAASAAARERIIWAFIPADQARIRQLLPEFLGEYQSTWEYFFSRSLQSEIFPLMLFIRADIPQAAGIIRPGYEPVPGAGLSTNGRSDRFDFPLLVASSDLCQTMADYQEDTFPVASRRLVPPAEHLRRELRRWFINSLVRQAKPDQPCRLKGSTM